MDIWDKKKKHFIPKSYNHTYVDQIWTFQQIREAIKFTTQPNPKKQRYRLIYRSYKTNKTMRIFIYCLLFTFPFGLFAQKNGVEITVAPYQPFVSTSILKTNFKGKGGLTLGGHYLRNLHKNLWFVTGLEFSAQKFQSICDCSQFPSESNGNGGYLRDEALDNITTRKQVGFQIPLLLRVAFPNKQLKPFVQGGLVQSTELYLDQKTKLPETTILTETEVFKRNLIGGRLATGIHFSLREKSFLSVSIFGQYSARVFKQAPLDTDVDWNMMQLGLEVGYRF
jgi:hypothetical protein